jgi:soluble lytic murein transglycosylase-like protein
MHRLGMLFLLAATAATAGEYAVLASGARLRVDRHEADGAKVRLYHDAGFVEMDAVLVKSYEPAPSAEPPAALPEASPKIPAAEPQVQPAPPPTVFELADAAADKYGLPRNLIRSVMAVESGNRPEAISPKGAIGLMQLMPGTAQDLGVDPHDPAQNVDAGARYLRDLLVKYNGGLWHALAAYNAGPGALEKYRGIPPYRETIDYIVRVDRRLKQAEAAPSPQE